MSRCAALWLCRVATLRFRRLAADFGAPLHWLPPGAPRSHRSPSQGQPESALLASSNKPLRPQLLQQRLRFLQITRVEPFSEPPVHRSQQFARLLNLALVAPEACEAHGGTKLPEFCLL